MFWNNNGHSLTVILVTHALKHDIKPNLRRKNLCWGVVVLDQGRWESPPSLLKDLGKGK